jgi:23S rRNA pseudouridine1911/1915/1917 synthase
MTIARWQVPAAAAGERLDRHVAAHLDVPRSQVQRWIRSGWVELDGGPAKGSTPVAAGASVRCRPPEPAGDERVEAEAGPLDVLYQDSDLVVVDKPAGLTVHPGAGRPRGTLAHRLLAHFPEMAGVGGPGRPGIVHRLDKDTSGVLVAARSVAAYRQLSRDFAGRRVAKRYLAVVYGAPKLPAGEIDAPIGRHPTRRKEMSVRPGGRPALTRYRRLAAASGAALLAVELATGRTHQIRVHLRSIGHPLVGDPVYGEARWKACARAAQRALREFPRPALHAWRLAFVHPTEARPVAFEAPVPEDLRRLWEEIGGGSIEAFLGG